MYSASQEDREIVGCFFVDQLTRHPNIESLSGRRATCAQISSPVSVHISDQFLSFDTTKYQTKILCTIDVSKKCVSRSRDETPPGWRQIDWLVKALELCLAESPSWRTSVIPLPLGKLSSIRDPRDIRWKVLNHRGSNWVKIRHAKSFHWR